MSETSTTNTAVYELSKALPNKWLNPDGSITDFQGNIISPASEINAEVYNKSKAMANKFITETGDAKTYAEIGLDLFIVVDELPEVGEKNKIYLVPGKDGKFEEYYWNINEQWDPIGVVDMEMDLSNYPTFDQMNKAIGSAVYNVLGGEY